MFIFEILTVGDKWVVMVDNRPASLRVAGVKIRRFGSFETANQFLQLLKAALKEEQND